MKSLLLIAASCLLFVACSTNDHDVEGIDVVQSGWQLAPDSLRNIPAYDTAYMVEPSGVEKWHYAADRGDLWVCVAGIIVLAIVILWYIFRNNSGDDKPGYIIPVVIAIMACGAIIGGSVDWERSNMGRDIPKPVYDSLMRANGDLHAYWDTVRH